MNVKNHTPVSLPTIILALTLDVVFVVVFSAVGRHTHASAPTLAGLIHTVWPFFAGLMISWVAAFVWRAPFAVLRSGVPVWVGTVAIGMLLRALTGGGVATAFVLVAFGVLGVLFMVSRLIALLITRLTREKC